MSASKATPARCNGRVSVTPPKTLTHGDAMPHSSTLPAPKKHAKPRPDFPLFPHKTGRWAKKVRGRFCYFGKVADDPKGEQALEAWLRDRDDLLAGRVPRNREGLLTVRDMVNQF